MLDCLLQVLCALECVFYHRLRWGNGEGGGGGGVPDADTDGNRILKHSEQRKFPHEFSNLSSVIKAKQL